jgi:5-methylcytosine-specific restriction enzyme subunit McrC
MAHLFETFVAAWLTAHAGEGLRFRPQRQVVWDPQNAQASRIDLVLENAVSGVPLCVLDTKYKAADSPSEADVHQIIFYALAMGCRQAVLIYPHSLAHPVDADVRGIRLRTLSFSLAGDLDAAGAVLLAELAGLRQESSTISSSSFPHLCARRAPPAPGKSPDRRRFFCVLPNLLMQAVPSCSPR